MGDIWLPGLPPTYTDYAECLRFLEPQMPTHEDAVILAAIGGAEGGYDMAVINDTPATGDYSVGVFQINYYNGLYAARVAAYGTPRQLIQSGARGQCKVASELWHAAGGFSPWAADILNNRWQQYVGSGPVPHNPGLGGVTGVLSGANRAASEVRHILKQYTDQMRHNLLYDNVFNRIGTPGWRP